MPRNGARHGFSLAEALSNVRQGDALPAGEQAAGYEIALNFAGLSRELIPRAASEIKGKAAVQLISVNEAEYLGTHAENW